MDDTLQGALRGLFGDSPGTQEQGPTTGPTVNPSPNASVADLLRQAADAFAAADKSLQAGDLAGYQQHITEARNFTRQAQDQSNANSATTPTTAKPATSA
jgi:hypothetical protein